MATKTEELLPYRADIEIPFDASVPIEVQRAVEEMNGKNTGRLVEELKEQIKTADNGIKYAVLSGENPQEYSEYEGIIFFPQYAHPLTPNVLGTAEFMRLVAKNYGITDQDGKYLPVIVTANPGLGGTELEMSRKDRKKIRQGDFGPIVAEDLKAIESLDIGRVAVMGSSYGGDKSARAASYIASGIANLDLTAVAAHDPAGVEERSKKALRKDFMAAGIPDMKDAIARSGLDFKKEVVDYKDMLNFGISSLYRSNKAIKAGLTRANAPIDLMATIAQKPSSLRKIYVAYGAESAIAKPAAIEPALEKLREIADDGLLTSVKLLGAKHSEGDNIPKIAAVFAQALR